MRRHSPILMILAVALFLPAACGNNAATESTGLNPTPPAPTIDPPPPATAVPITAGSSPVATRIGADYVRLLPRESAVPAGWLFSPSPDYETRRPRPGDTYRFACLDLPARSVAVASVGYRNLEGLPNVHIEYVIYPSAEHAKAALEDMRRATEMCAEFTIGQEDGATAAAFDTLEFPGYGDAGFAAALSTVSPLTGELLTHVVKVQQGHVVIGISHADYAENPPPDAALTESLVALAVSNLKDGPAPSN